MLKLYISEYKIRGKNIEEDKRKSLKLEDILAVKIIQKEVFVLQKNKILRINPNNLQREIVRKLKINGEIIGKSERGVIVRYKHEIYEIDFLTGEVRKIDFRGDVDYVYLTEDEILGVKRAGTRSLICINDFRIVVPYPVRRIAPGYYGDCGSLILGTNVFVRHKCR